MTTGKSASKNSSKTKKATQPDKQELGNARGIPKQQEYTIKHQRLER